MKQPTREDYELAAKAAGIVLIWAQIRDGIPAPHHQPNKPVVEPWKPLDDDGDSRRLEVAINATMFRDSRYIDAVVHDLRHSVAYKDHNNDKCEAARHAVFWLAVEIGRAMP